MIPLIILDLDGTIVGKQGIVQDCVWKAVTDAQAAGMKFAVCTGRLGVGAAQKIAQRLGPNNPHIFQSGAHIAYPSGEAYKVFGLKRQLLKRLLKWHEIWGWCSSYTHPARSMSSAPRPLVRHTPKCSVQRQ